MHRIGLGRRSITAVLLGLTALAIGAVFGTARDGGAAITAKPSNTAPPAITGSAKEGSTLTAVQRIVGRHRADHLRLRLEPLRPGWR